MKCNAKEIGKLIARIRDGKPPKLREGKFEEVYMDYAALRGFGVRVLHTGAASWFVHYGHLGRQKKVTLGDVRALDRKDAIEAARDVLAKARVENLDPVKAKREAAQAAKMTFAAAVEPFLAYKRSKGLRPGTLRAYRTRLTNDFFRTLHKKPLEEISGPEISNCLDYIISKSGQAAAFAACSTIKGLFKWAISKGWAQQNPMTSVENPEPSTARKRVLSNDEIRLIWKTSEDWLAKLLAENEARKKGNRPPVPLRSGYGGNPDLPRCIQLLFVTGCRKQEIGNLRWDQVDLDNREICIRKEDTKNRRHKDADDFHLPLSDMAVDILRHVPERPGHPYVFGRTTNKTGEGLDISHASQKIDERTRLGVKMLKVDPAKEQRVRDRLAAGNSKSQIRRELHVDWYTIDHIERRMEDDLDISDAETTVSLPHWTPHDIRRTVRTRLTEECGVEKDIAEHLVGHIVGKKIVRTYDRSEFWEKKVEAMTKWQNLLRSIIAGTAKEIPRSKFGRKLAAAA
jgi:integrase